MKYFLYKNYFYLSHAGAWPPNPRVISESQIGRALSRLALGVVKTHTYTDLPYESCFNAEEYLEKSNHRSGLYGWVNDLGADFWVITEEKDSLGFWKQKLKRPNQEHHNRIRFSQKESSVDYNEIDFSKYDIVLTYECAVPERITRRFPSVIWMTMLEDHRMREFSSFLKSAPTGYDLFCDQFYGPFGIFSKRRLEHVVSLPYIVPSLRNLGIRKKSNKAIIDSEYHTSVASIFEKYNITVQPNGNLSLSEYFDTLAASKFYFSFKPSSPRWGNGFVEAAGFNCINMGNPYTVWRPCLLSKEGSFNKLKQLESTLEYTLRDDVAGKILEHQRSCLLDYCWYLPFIQILKYGSKIQRFSPRRREFFRGLLQGVEESLES